MPIEGDHSDAIGELDELLEGVRADHEDAPPILRPEAVLVELDSRGLRPLEGRVGLAPEPGLHPDERVEAHLHVFLRHLEPPEEVERHLGRLRA